jgi:epoxyqueuosine reductase
MDARQLTDDLKSAAARLGFDLAAACPAVTPSGVDRFHDWLARGYAGEMTYLPRHEEACRHPAGVMPGVRSLLVVAMNYRTVEPEVVAHGTGRVSRYAWGSDYHTLIRSRLGDLADTLRRHVPEARVRAVVDTAPLLEREFAQLAGLGWIGKNTLLLNRQFGSWFFLAALLTDIELAYDDPHVADHCGTCRACLDACPTQAFVEPYVLDARRCISYLTIELRGPMPRDLRQGIGDWLFGCDVCQDVCPWNGRVPACDEKHLSPEEGRNPTSLIALLALDEAAFRERFRHTPLWRAKRRGLLRNAAIVLGNQRHLPAVPALVQALSDEERLVRGAAAWALGRCGSTAALAALERRLPDEDEPDVRSEIEDALATVRL